MFEVNSDDECAVDGTGPETWMVSMKNALEFIDALNFQEYISIDEIEMILKKRNTEKIKYTDIINEIADLLIVQKKIHSCQLMQNDF